MLDVPKELPSPVPDKKPCISRAASSLVKACEGSAAPLVSELAEVVALEELDASLDVLADVEVEEEAEVVVSVSVPSDSVVIVVIEPSGLMRVTTVSPDEADEPPPEAPPAEAPPAEDVVAEDVVVVALLSLLATA